MQRGILSYLAGLPQGTKDLCSFFVTSQKREGLNLEFCYKLAISFRTMGEATVDRHGIGGPSDGLRPVK